MTRINTALGPIDPEELGRTLMHEPVFVLSPEVEKWPAGQSLDACAEWDEEARLAEPDDIGGVVLMLSSALACKIRGQTLVVDGDPSQVPSG